MPLNSSRSEAKSEKPYDFSPRDSQRSARSGSARGSARGENGNASYRFGDGVSRPMTSGGVTGFTGIASARDSARNSSRKNMFDLPPSGKSKAAAAPAMEASVDPEEFLARMRATKQAESKAAAAAEVAELQGYNQFSRPKVSNAIPLRSSFLDPRINNIPKSKTRSELMMKIKATNIPHHSFDIDGDGYVSQEDLLLGKRFDLDGNGLLDPEEQEVGRRIIAEEFFKAHRHDVHMYGSEYASASENENIDRVAKSYTFTKIMNGLKEKEKHYRDRGSYSMTECLTAWNPDLVKNNFYANKFDTTAWNDFGAEPRAPDFMTQGNHNGSRHAMFNLRKIVDREKCQGLMNVAEGKKPKYSTRRTALITNVAIENS